MSNIPENTLSDLLDKICKHEDSEPDKRKKRDHKAWEQELIRLYIKYNDLIGFKAFKEHL